MKKVNSLRYLVPERDDTVEGTGHLYSCHLLLLYLCFSREIYY